MPVAIVQGKLSCRLGRILPRRATSAPDNMVRTYSGPEAVQNPRVTSGGLSFLGILHRPAGRVGCKMVLLWTFCQVLSSPSFTDSG
jgi:hypothetical protein